MLKKTAESAYFQFLYTTVKYTQTNGKIYS